MGLTNRNRDSFQYMFFGQEIEAMIFGSPSLRISVVGFPFTRRRTATYSPRSVGTSFNSSGGTPIFRAKPTAGGAATPCGVKGDRLRRTEHELLAIGLPLGYSSEKKSQPAGRAEHLQGFPIESALAQQAFDRRRESAPRPA